MWIVNPDWKAYRREEIRIGTLGYFMEGAKPVASCEVIELIGLK